MEKEVNEEDEDQNGDQFTYSSLNVVSYYSNYYSIFQLALHLSIKHSR